MADTHDPNPHDGASSPPQFRLKKPLPDVPRIIGEDGELVVATPVKRKRHAPGSRSARLTTTRLLLLLIAVVLVVGGVAVGIKLLTLRDAALLNQQPNVAVIPKEFVGGPYQPFFTVFTSTQKQFPCIERIATVVVEGTRAVDVRVWTWPDQGDFVQTKHLGPRDLRRLQFHIPASAARTFNAWVYDENGQALSGVNDVTIGISGIPYCAITITFDLFGG